MKDEIYIHDEEIPNTAVLRVSVSVHKKAIENVILDDRGWTNLPASEYVVVKLEITPDGWRSLASSLLRFPNEPEVRLQTASIDGLGYTSWSDCAARGSGPGVWMDDKSCCLQIYLNDELFSSKDFDVTKIGNSNE